MARSRPERPQRPVREPLPGADPQETLAWEARFRRPAAIAAVIAGIGTLGGGLLTVSGYNGVPTGGVIEALTPALQGKTDVDPSPRTPLAQFLADHVVKLSIAGALTMIGAIAAGFALLFLLRATRARRPEVPGFARWVVIAGAGFYGITAFLLPLVQGLKAQSFIDSSDHSRHAINAALGHGPLVVIGAVGTAGGLAFALAFVLVCVNAMRAGLLTRFMGILGFLVGALYVLRIGNVPVVQSFWLVALVPLFLVQWPGGSPPAWTSGKAEPWPTQAEQREQRMRDQTAKRGAGTADPTLEDAFDRGAEPAPVPRANANRKRRKRR
jgi:hypothetical protein